MALQARQQHRPLHGQRQRFHLPPADAGYELERRGRASVSDLVDMAIRDGDIVLLTASGAVYGSADSVPRSPLATLTARTARAWPAGRRPPLRADPHRRGSTFHRRRRHGGARGPHHVGVVRIRASDTALHVITATGDTTEPDSAPPDGRRHAVAGRHRGLAVNDGRCGGHARGTWPPDGATWAWRGR